MNEQLQPIFYLIVLLAAIGAFALRKNGRQALLLGASVIVGALFYPCWLLTLIVVAAGVVFPLARLFAATRGSRGALWFAVLALTAALVGVRSDAFGHFWDAATAKVHFGPAGSQIATVVGTSYFVLRALSLWFDAANGKIGGAPIGDRPAGPMITLIGVLTYLFFFPTFVSGPIDRYARFCAEISQPRAVDAGTVDAALWRGVVGLFKKVVLADTLARLCWPADAGCVARVEMMTHAQVWLAFYAYAARIYLDFSGYTDVAIAIGMLLGVRVPENFRSPYLSRNITEFWKRWHISLSEWLRDYIFLPVGVSLSRGIFKGRSLAAGCSAALLAFGLCGLWHGTTLNFLIWGLLHGVWVFAHKAYSDLGRTRLPAGWWSWSRKSAPGGMLAALLTFHGVAFTWIWFSTPDPAAAWAVMAKMAGR